jgi:hypothetical protein
MGLIFLFQLVTKSTFPHACHKLLCIRNLGWRVTNVYPIDPSKDYSNLQKMHILKPWKSLMIDLGGFTFNSSLWVELGKLERKLKSP